jgi:hypothetical protein
LSKVGISIGTGVITGAVYPTDGANTASQTFNWTVTHVFVVNPGDQQNADGDSVILPINAGENDGTPVTYSAVGLPPGLSINSAGNIVGTISSTADVGSPYSVTVSATDGTYSDSQTFNWTVSRLQVTSPGYQTNTGTLARRRMFSSVDRCSAAAATGAMERTNATKSVRPRMCQASLRKRRLRFACPHCKASRLD